jgi:hypothetical protein
MMACRGNVGLAPFITSELGGVDGSKNVPVNLPPGRYASTHRTVGWMDTRVVLCGFGEEKISYPSGIRTPGLPAGTSHSLYRLRCSGSLDSVCGFISTSDWPYFNFVNNSSSADPGGCAVWGVGPRLLFCWDRGSNTAEGMHVGLLCLLCAV